MADQKNEVQLSFGDFLTNKLTTVEEALPKDFNKTRFVQNALYVLNEHPELQKVNKPQLAAGLMKGAYLNLDYSNKEFYLIPYGNSVQFQYDYKGLKKIAKAYSMRPIKDIYAKLIREGDEFEEAIINGEPSINFHPKTLNNGEVLGAFAVCLYTDGTLQYEVMTTEEIQDVRKKYSKAGNTAWAKSPNEMFKKTVLRRLCKSIEISFETVEARKAFEDGEDSNIATKSVSQDIVSNPFAKKDDEPVEDVVATVIAEEVD